MKLAPYRNELRTIETKDYVGTGIFKTPVNLNDLELRYAVPPKGYRRLIEYDLSRPGRYNAAFVIQEPLDARFGEWRPGNPFQNLMGWLAAPPIFSPVEKLIPITVRSEAQSIEVPRAY